MKKSDIYFMGSDLVINNLKETLAGRLLLHVILWLAYFGAFYYLASISFNGYGGNTDVLESLKNTITCILVYYPLIYLVWPKFWLKKKYIVSLLIVMVIVITYATVDHLLERAILLACDRCMEKIRLNQHGFYELFQKGAISVILVQLVSLGIVYQLFLFLAFPIAVKVLLEYYNQHVKTLRLQQENTMLEFNFLRAQVNPHFLFNTLNNIYALILKDKKEASAETVSKLSSFMRYTLYESNSNKNNVVKEIDLLRVYIDLEKIRLNDTVVNFICTVDTENYSLPPLLFLPAVENAFKFCTKNEKGDAYIFVKLAIEGATLMFAVSNTYDNLHRVPGITGGIGLQNLRKRLYHYYPGNLSSMEISEDDTIFQIAVHINLA